MAFKINDDYLNEYVEAQTNLVTTDPYGNKFTIWQGQQFKYTGSEVVLQGCCGAQKKVTTYYINAYAHCCEGEYLWPDGDSGKTIQVYSDVFQETINLKLPPIITDYADEMSGKNTDMFTPPWQRSVPREGGVWYVDPWDPLKITR